MTLSPNLDAAPPRVLLTGASGFLGRASLALLQRSGVEIVATCRGAPPTEDIPGVTWVSVDLTDGLAIADVCAIHRPTHLLALAWYMAPGYQQAPENYRWMQHSVDLLFAFAAEGGTRAVFCGSCMEYDWSLETPFIEEISPLLPDTDYGVAKAALSNIYGPLCRRLGLSGAWARPYFLYGPGENPRRLAADVIISLLEGRDALCGHGRQKRDFLHVEDVADAMVQLLFSAVEGPVNIGSGQAIPMATLIEEIGHQIGRPDLIKLGAREARPGDPDLVEADTSRLSSRLGWRPHFTLQTGIADTIAWWRHDLLKDSE